LILFVRLPILDYISVRIIHNLCVSSCMIHNLEVQNRLRNLALISQIKRVQTQLGPVEILGQR
jgi:hypothetical protein